MIFPLLALTSSEFTAPRLPAPRLPTPSKHVPHLIENRYIWRDVSGDFSFCLGISLCFPFVNAPSSVPSAFCL
ncbi:MAG: hypothetical protein F6K56_16595 [Moorea sp. SIO3G5]|nr:hypothetical protein [Moorena sp. SIO3G5]